MKKINKLNKVLNIKNLAKSLLAILFSLSYLGYMKLGTEVCEIDEIYCIYFCSGILAYLMWMYAYNYVCDNLFIKVEKDSDIL